ncbi:MAG: XRE family transcriptional regulator [Candidatus Brocadiales bacterium]|nr:XRE family transcriptional regulator [Candidatus Brocadiales bacterium]
MKKDYTIGSGNVFKDLGFENPEDELAKVRLASIINEIIGKRGLTQDHAGKILGVNQPKISALKNGILKGFSIERLFSFLEKLDQHIEITITDKSKVKANRNIEVSFIH